MIAFFQKQIAQVEKDLMQLYEDRARCGIETIGSYEIMIERKKKERLRLMQELEELRSSESNGKAQLSDADRSAIEKSVSKGRLQEAIDKLSKCSADTRVTGLSTQLSLITSQQIKGTLSASEQMQALNKLTDNILTLLPLL